MKSVVCLLLAVSSSWYVASTLGHAASFQKSATQSQNENESKPLIASLQGSDLFREYCAACHGVDGRGNGPAAAALRTKPPDLTTIKKRNGDTFPAKRVRETIAGNERITAHGSREMPIWGPIFHQVERDRDWGYVRLENVTKYLESIQQK